MDIAGPFTIGPAVGDSGSAVASLETQHLSGLLYAIMVTYHFVDSIYNDDELDLIIETSDSPGSPPLQGIFSLEGAGTDGRFYPRVQTHSTSGSPVADQIDGLIPLSESLVLSIESAEPGDTVDVWFLLG
jgi:hypothetical protein